MHLPLARPRLHPPALNIQISFAMGTVGYLHLLRAGWCRGGCGDLHCVENIASRSRREPSSSHVWCGCLFYGVLGNRHHKSRPVDHGSPKAQQVGHAGHTEHCSQNSDAGWSPHSTHMPSAATACASASSTSSSSSPMGAVPSLASLCASEPCEAKRLRGNKTVHLCRKHASEPLVGLRLGTCVLT